MAGVKKGTRELAKAMALLIKQSTELLLDLQTFERVKPPCQSVVLVPTLFPEL